MSKPMKWDRSLDNPKQKKSRPDNASSKWKKGSWKRSSEAIWKQGKGGS